MTRKQSAILTHIALLGLCAGLDQPSTGSVHLDGREIGGLSEDARQAAAAIDSGAAATLLERLARLDAARASLEVGRAAVAQARESRRIILDRYGSDASIKALPPA